MRFNPSAWIRLPAEYHPDRLCVKYKGRSLTYGRINSRANQLAQALLGRGFNPGDRIATLQYNGPQSLELFVALWKAGLVEVPLNTRDSVARNIDVLRDSQARALFFGEEFQDQLGPVTASGPDLKEMVCLGGSIPGYTAYEDLLSGAEPVEPDLDMDEDDLYKIHYTSGTTGLPRGVLMTYRNRKEQVANVFMNADRLITRDDVFLHVAPLTHAAGYYATPYYLKGATHVILDKFDPDAVLRTLAQEKVTVTLLVPTMIVMLLEHPEVESFDCSSLARVFYGTAPMPEAKLRRAISVFGQVFRQNYGLTEAVQPLASLTPEEHVVNGTDQEVGRLVSTGRRALGPELRVVDDRDRDLPPGEVGEILIRGPHVSPGYLDLPEATAETFRGGWLHTGDLGRIDRDGYVFIVDRKKDMIISGGFNIYSREVELYLDAHPDVLESAVVGQPDEKWGEVCKACVVLKNGCQEPDPEELVRWCIQQGLTKYKAPKIVRFLGRLPKNENKKIIKAALTDA